MINYMIDTNVALGGLNEFIKSVKDCGVILPSTVLEEADRQKSRDGEIGFKARKFTRELFDIKKYGSLNDWIKLENNVSLHVEHHYDKDLHLKYEINDDNIIGCLSLCNKKFGKTILVSNDILMCLKAEGFGFNSMQFYGKDDVDLYEGHIEVEVDDYVIDEFYKKGSIDWQGILHDKPLENMCVTLKSSFNEKKQALSIYRNGVLNKLIYGDGVVFGNKALNRQQKYALELLMNPDIKIVTIHSPAGGGKSYLATISALQQTLESSIYSKILFVKPLVSMGGSDIGYLPASKTEKLLGGHYGTISNILENIFVERDSQYKDMSYAEDLIDRGILQIEAMTFMRGNSYPNTFYIIDEAENISIKDIKSLAERTGKNSKLVLLGDINQIDLLKNTKYDNGLTHVINRLKNNSIYGCIKLDKSVRSDVAQLCVDLL